MFDFKTYLSKLGNEPQWLKDKRTLAFDQFTKAESPNPSEEGWRLLDIEAIDFNKLLDNVTSVSKPVQQANNVRELDKHLAACSQMTEFVQDPIGVFVESPQGIWFHIDEELSRKGVIVTTWQEAASKHSHLLDKRNKLEQKGNKFSFLNEALAQSGIFIYIPQNVEIKKPLLYINLHSQTPLSLSRLSLVIDKHARLSFINVLVASQTVNDGPLALANNVLDVSLQTGAELDYVEVQNFSHNTFAVSHSYYTFEQDSRFNGLVAALGGGQIKSEVHLALHGRGAETNLNGVVLGNKNERFNFNTIEEHMAPDTKSTIDFRVALKDESQSIYLGTIQVDKAAQKTDAFQSNKNLLLGEKAHADSIPKLEILADDVKCSHGATVGPVDRKQIFYLMSRGLSEEKAEELIVSGFFHQLLNNCSIEGVSDWLDSMLASKISPGHNEQNSKDSASKESNKKQPALTR